MLDRKIKIEMLKRMILIRAFEEKAEELFMRNLVHGTMHLSVGEDAVAVGSIFALNREDYITSTHRGHGHMIAKGGDIKKMFAEFLGKDTGYCHGRGGSMHIADFSLNNIGATGIVGAGIPIATGAAFAIKYMRRKEIVLCFFGDGAANEGTFYESLNMASIWNLPIIFMCENNMYAMSSPVSKFIPTPNISDRAKSFSIPGVTVDGMDVIAVYEVTKEAADRARNGGGPTLIEAKTYRYKGHSKSDKNVYRTKEEIEEWKKKDPIVNFIKKLKDLGDLDDKTLESIKNDIEKTIEKGVNFALNSKEPSPDTLMWYVYANGDEK
ncbi:MAG TPA: thiamine pyrophosphate-dependent dehydrogenase E1 component subunit alpha [Firmicutes bacterium]|nr:thiamine pyrophosphate-dependent dehydrogenase E1 component subunit alpha [Bacillota bacterium]